MLKQISSICVVGLFFLTATSCKKDDDKFTPMCDGSNPTYNGEIKAIIDANCTASGCHNAGSSNGAWTSYQNMKPVLDNGKFEKQVLIDQTMPKNSSLSESTLNTIQCWVDNGYPEN